MKTNQNSYLDRIGKEYILSVQTQSVVQFNIQTCWILKWVRYRFEGMFLLLISVIFATYKQQTVVPHFIGLFQYSDYDASKFLPKKLLNSMQKVDLKVSYLLIYGMDRCHEYS